MGPDWRELKKTDARAALFELLAEFHVDYSLIEHAKSGKTSEAAASATGEERGNIVKSMLLRNGQSEYLGVIVCGDRRMDFGKVGECARSDGSFSSDNFVLARPDEIRTALGFDVGGIPPFAFYMGGVAAFVDSLVMVKDHVFGAAGSEFSGIRFSPREFAKFGYSVREVIK